MLNYQAIKLEHAVSGSQTGILKDSVNGDLLIVQSGELELRLKIADIVALVNAQAEQAAQTKKKKEKK